MRGYCPRCVIAGSPLVPLTASLSVARFVASGPPGVTASRRRAERSLCPDACRQPSDPVIGASHVHRVPGREQRPSRKPAATAVRSSPVVAAYRHPATLTLRARRWDHGRSCSVPSCGGASSTSSVGSYPTASAPVVRSRRSPSFPQREREPARSPCRKNALPTRRHA